MNAQTKITRDEAAEQARFAAACTAAAAAFSRPGAQWTNGKFRALLELADALGGMGFETGDIIPSALDWLDLDDDRQPVRGDDDTFWRESAAAIARGLVE